MSGQLTTYRNEIFNFLRTVTIKFDHFAWLMGEDYMNRYGLTDPHGTWNPYYIHLSGCYTPEELADPSRLIHVYTVEKEAPEDIIFDKNTINTNPKTASLYRIPNKEYTILEERYPEYVGLIRTIAYPISSIEDAIAAPNLTLLAYDDSLLEENERESMITCLKNFLKMVKERWYIEEYTYDNMYAVTFWAMLWQMLPIVLLKQRIKNIKTPSVHSFHIWEYLTSKGLGDYRDILTKRQSLWLYRNIEYIKANQGKERTLKILAENLLGDAFVSLLYKNMHQNITDYSSKLVTKPEFISYSYLTNVPEKIEQVEDLNSRLFDQGIEYRNNYEYVNKLETNLGYTPYSTLNTKFLEFKKDSMDTSGEKLMTNMYLDTLAYMLSENKLSFNVPITETLAGESFKLFVSDAFLLMCWCAARSAGIDLEFMPKYYMCSRAVRLTKPPISDLTQSLFYNGHEYQIKYLADTRKMLDNLNWTERAFVTQRQFGDWINERYDKLSIYLRHNDVSNKLTYHLAMRSLWNDIAINKLLELNFVESDTWVGWYSGNASVNNIIRVYEHLTDTARTQAYAKLAVTCFNAIFETEEGVDGATNLRRMERIYSSVRDLFIQLCSYNITYLEADRETSDYIRFRDPDFVINSKIDYIFNNATTFNLILSDFIFNNKNGLITRRDINDIALKDLNIEHHVVRDKIENHIDKIFNIKFDIKKNITHIIKQNNIVNNDIEKNKQIINLNFKLNIGNSTKFKVIEQ